MPGRYYYYRRTLYRAVALLREMSRSHVTTGGPGYFNQPLSLPTCLPLPGLGKWGRPDVVATLRHFRKGESPSLRTSPPHPGGRPTQPAGRIPAPVCRLGVFVGTRRPALTPGGGRDPSHSRAGAAGRFPGKGYRGREQSAPVGEGGLADGGWGGRSLSGDPREGLCRPDSCFEGTHSSPKADAGVLPKDLPPGPGSTSVPLSPRLHCAGQGTRLPFARLQHKARPGEGKSHSGVHRR